MFRLSDTYSISLSEKNLYNITLLVWYSYFDNETNELIQNYDKVIVEKCNIDNHFSDYKNLFYNIRDLDNYFCPRIRNKNQSLFGIYGDNKPFLYYVFYFSKCINNTNENNNCLPDLEIEKKLSDIYLDIKYISYLNPKYSNKEEIIIKNDRFIVSSSIYKRIWLFFNYVKYKIDNGIFFPSYIKSEYHQYDNSRIDIDLRNKSLNDIEGTFLTVTILTSGNIYNYKKRYLKIQDYLATIGGIVKAITYIFYLLNYFNSVNSYYTQLIKDFIIENQSIKKNYKTEIILNQKKNQNTINDINNNINKFLNIPSTQSTPNYFKNSNNIIVDKIKNKNDFEKKYQFKFLPLFITVNYKDKKEIEWKIKIINRKLNIINILNHLELIEKLQKEIEFEYNISMKRYNTVNNICSNSNIHFNSLNNLNKNNNNINNLNNSSSLRIIPENENDIKTNNFLFHTYIGQRNNIIEKINNNNHSKK